MPSEDEIRKWCEEHDYSFYAMGCPEDWDRKDCFRVVGGTAWASYGVTVLLSVVEEWLNNPPSHYCAL